MSGYFIAKVKTHFHKENIDIGIILIVTSRNATNV